VSVNSVFVSNAFVNGSSLKLFVELECEVEELVAASLVSVTVVAEVVMVTVVVTTDVASKGFDNPNSPAMSNYKICSHHKFIIYIMVVLYIVGTIRL